MKITRHRLSKPARKRGNALLEGALVLTVALVTFIGLIDVGSVLFRIQGLVERARAGARYGVVSVFSASEIQNVVVYGNAAGSGSPLLALSTSQVQVTQLDLGDDQLKIQVVITGYQVQFFTPFIAGVKTLPDIEVPMTAESQGATT